MECEMAIGPQAFWMMMIDGIETCVRTGLTRLSGVHLTDDIVLELITTSLTVGALRKLHSPISPSEVHRV